MLNHFSSLLSSLPSRILLTFLCHSPLPVLRTPHSVLTPTFVRDFLTLLPHELVSHVLSSSIQNEGHPADVRLITMWHSNDDPQPTLRCRSGTHLKSEFTTTTTTTTYAPCPILSEGQQAPPVAQCIPTISFTPLSSHSAMEMATTTCAKMTRWFPATGGEC